MLDFAKQFGIAGGFGALIGLVLATVVVQPTTNGGIFLAIAIPTLACWVVVGIAKALLGSRDKSGDDKTDDASDDQDKDDKDA
jgi:hypothetical protein